MNENPISLLRAIRKACGPDLVDRKYRKLIPPDVHRTWGCCYVATETLYLLWGKKNGFKPYFIRFRFNTPKGPIEHWLPPLKRRPRKRSLTHWYLMNSKGRVLDVTASQFKGWRPNYKKGICVGFQKIKNETQQLMQRLSKF